MALANFFDKAALAASQILQGYNKEDFEKRLSAVCIELAFDSKAVNSVEGVATLDLATRLLSRLYPTIIFKSLDFKADAYRNQLENLSKSINPEIELQDLSPFATIIVGDTVVQRDGHTFYIGSNEWTVHFSINQAVGSGTSQNPFGAGAAACFGAANVFRTVFKDQLPHGVADMDFTLSLMNFEKTDLDSASPLANDQVELGEAFLVGLGAIGNGVLWALSKINTLEGRLHVIDHEKLELSNLQRYVLATQDDLNMDKVTLCEKYDKRKVFEPYKGNWASFLATRQDWNFPLVVLAVDSAEDRIAIQSSLPNLIINAWTQPLDLGVSRHFDFINQACVACLYPPKQGLQSKSQLIAGALGLSHLEVMIRELIFNNTPLNESWIRQIAEAKQISFDILMPYIGMSISAFYSKVLCGGLVTTNAMNQQMETPMAFQSALAGILLASEMVIYATNKRKTPIATMTRINLLRPVTEYMNDPLRKTIDPNCICNDRDFQAQYKMKYFK